MKDPSGEVDLKQKQKQVYSVTINRKIHKGSFSTGPVSKYLQNWVQITSEKRILQNVSRGT